jgi:hypothetical protein
MFYLEQGIFPGSKRMVAELAEDGFKPSLSLIRDKIDKDIQYKGL